MMASATPTVNTPRRNRPRTAVHDASLRLAFEVHKFRAFLPERSPHRDALKPVIARLDELLDLRATEAGR